MNFQYINSAISAGIYIFAYYTVIKYRLFFTLVKPFNKFLHGKKDKDGHFPAGTVNYLVYEKLKKYAKIDENK